MCLTKKHFCTFLLIALTFLIGLPSNAMQLNVTLESLVKKSDVIAVVDVLAVKEIGTLPSGFKVVANMVKVNQPLKGYVAVGERLKLKTHSNVEDDVDLSPGQQCLVFLKKVKNYYEIVSGIAGSWPIDKKSGKITGFGLGKSLKDVESAIETANKASLTPKIQSNNKKRKISL